MIRRNFLTDAAAARQFIDGVLQLKDPDRFPWTGQEGLSVYDSFVFWHHQSMMLMTPPSQSDRNAAHSGPAFLPWHRYFLITLENLLRRALDDDDFRLPYWDWSADAELRNFYIRLFSSVSALGTRHSALGTQEKASRPVICFPSANVCTSCVPS